MSPPPVLAKRRGGGGADDGGGRSSSSKSSSSSRKPWDAVFPSPKPAPAPKAAPAPPPTSKPPPKVLPPVLTPTDSGAKKSGKDKDESDKKVPTLPTLPTIPKGFKPKQNGHYYENDSGRGRYITSPNSSPAGSGHCSKSCSIGIGATVGALIVAATLLFLFFRYRRRVVHTQNRKACTVGRDKDIKLGAHCSPDGPKRPNLAHLKAECVDRVAKLRKQLGSKNSMARSEQVDEPSHDEERLSREGQNAVGQGGGIREGSTASDRGIFSGKSGDEPPSYTKKDVGHCEDLENPCRKKSGPHIFIETSAEGRDVQGEGKST